MHSGMNRILFVPLPAGGVPDGFYAKAARHAADNGTGIYAVYVVDSVWSRYAAADWLSNGHSRSEFEEYMHKTLTDEGEEMIARLAKAACDAGVDFTSEVIEGDPERVFAMTSGGSDAVLRP